MNEDELYGKQFEDYLEEIGEIGFVESTSHPIVNISGLPRVSADEVVFFESGEIGLVQSMSKEMVEVLVLSKESVRVGSKVARTGRRMEVPVGMELRGHTLDPLGRPLLLNKPFKNPQEFRPVDNTPIGIDSRVVVNRPLETGVTVVDLLVPLGKGQRELVIGDRKTGRTNFILQTILTQALQGSICIYAAIGRRKTDIKKVAAFFEDYGILENTILIASGSSDSMGMIYLTPYTAMALAEYFRDMGRDVLVVLDDLTTHAKYYREVSLLARRFPGRNSYPGDIFYVHSRLLERAGSFKYGEGEVAITCLPVAESVEGDISGYIQTNLMSMTDGHIYFDKDLFSRGRRPSVNYFLSVTRVGRQTQSAVRWGVNRELGSFLTLLEKTRSFVHFGVEVNDAIQATMSMGERILEFFNQNMGQIIPMRLQIALFCIIWLGTWNDKNTVEMRRDIEKVINAYKTKEDYRRKVDEYVDTSTDLNNLIGKLSSVAADLVREVA